MEARRKFEEKAWVNNEQVESEFKEGALSEIEVNLDLTVSGTVGTIAQDALLKTAGILEVSQNGSRLKGDQRLFYYLDAVYERGVRNLSASATLGIARYCLPFHRMIPDAGMDAIEKTVAVRMGLRNGLAYGNGASPAISVNSRVRPIAVTARRSPDGGFRDPDWVEERILIESNSSQHTRKFEIKTDSLVPGILLMALDANGDAGGTLLDNTFRTDSAVARVTVELFGLADGAPSFKIVDDVPWGVLRANTARLAGWTAADVTATAGVVWIPFTDRKDGEDFDALLMRKSSHMVITINNVVADFENGITPITPGSGDRVSFLVPKFFYRPKVAPLAAPTLAVSSQRAANRHEGRRVGRFAGV